MNRSITQHIRVQAKEPAQKARSQFKDARWWFSLGITLLLVVPAVVSLTQAGNQVTIDGDFHISRMMELQNSLANGQILPRWNDPWVAGLGFPVMVFYGPFPYYLGLLLTTMGLTLADAFEMMLLFIPFLSATLMFSWMSTMLRGKGRNGFLGTLPAVVAAVVYAISPYTMFNTFVRGGFSENLAMALLPGLMLSFRALTSRPGIIHLTASALMVALLLITHNTTSVLALPFAAGYGVVNAIWPPIEKGRWRKLATQRLLWLIIAGFLGLGLAAFFWLPAFLERGYLPGNFEYLKSGYWDAGTRLLDSWPLIQESFIFDYSGTKGTHLGLAQVLVALPGLIYIIWAWRAKRSVRALQTESPLGSRNDLTPTEESWAIGRCSSLFATGIYLWIAFALIAVVLTPVFAEFWRWVPILNSIQFPWRLLMLATLCLAFSTGLGIFWLGNKGKTWLAAATIIAITVIEMSSIARLPVNQATAIPIGQYRAHGVAVYTGWSPQYNWPDPMIEHMDALKSSQIRSFAVSPGFISLDVQVLETTQVALHVLAYPGWTVDIDGQPVPTFPLTGHHLLGFDIPPGEHQVLVHFEGTPLRLNSERVTLVCLLILVAIIIYSTIRRHPPLFPMAILVVMGIVFVIPHLATPKTPTTISFTCNQNISGDLRLHAASLVKGKASEAALTLCWQTLTPLPPKEMFVTLVDDAGCVAGVESRLALDGTYPTEDWQAGELIFDHVDITLPNEFDLEHCRLQAGLRDPDPTHIAKPDANFTIQLTTAEPATTSLRPITYRVADYLGLEQPQFPTRTLIPGAELPIDLYWHAFGSVPNDATIYLHLIDAQGKMWAQVDSPAGPKEYRSLLWNKGEFVREQRVIPIPTFIPAGKYELRLGAYHFNDSKLIPVQQQNNSQEQEDIVLGIFYVAPPNTVRQDVQPQHPLEVNFGGMIELVGYDLSSTELRPGDTVTLTTYWRALRQMSTDYTLFTQALDSANIVRGQDDGQPVNGGYPTSVWQQGEYIVDQRSITIDPSTPPDQLCLIVGFYEWPSLKRLQVEDGSGSGDSVSLTTLSIDRAPTD